MAMTWRHWALGTIVLLLVLPALWVALKSRDRQLIAASAAPPAEPNTRAALPPGWKLEPTPAPDSIVAYSDGRVTTFREAQQDARRRQVEKLDLEAMQSIVEFDERQASRRQAQDDVRETVRAELRREELLRGQ